MNSNQTDQSSKLQIVLFFLLIVFFFMGGVNHFRNPDFYLKMIPPFLPYHNEINLISGFAEILLSLMLLFPATRKLACYGLIALLVAVYPANIYMFVNSLNGIDYSVPTWALALRLPFQFLFIYWAWKMKHVVILSK